MGFHREQPSRTARKNKNLTINIKMWNKKDRCFFQLPLSYPDSISLSIACENFTFSSQLSNRPGLIARLQSASSIAASVSLFGCFSFPSKEILPSRSDWRTEKTIHRPPEHSGTSVPQDAESKMKNAASGSDPYRSKTGAALKFFSLHSRNIPKTKKRNS